MKHTETLPQTPACQTEMFISAGWLCVWTRLETKWSSAHFFLSIMCIFYIMRFFFGGDAWESVKTLLAFSPTCSSLRTHGSKVTRSSSTLLMNYGRAVWPCAATWPHMFSNTHILSRQRWRRWKNMAQSKWFTLGLTQHIDPSKLLLNASPEGPSVLYCTALSEATGFLLFYSFN